MPDCILWILFVSADRQWTSWFLCKTDSKLQQYKFLDHGALHSGDTKLAQSDVYLCALVNTVFQKMWNLQTFITAWIDGKIMFFVSVKLLDPKQVCMPPSAVQNCSNMFFLGGRRLHAVVPSTFGEYSSTSPNPRLKHIFFQTHGSWREIERTSCSWHLVWWGVRLESHLFLTAKTSNDHAKQVVGLLIWHFWWLLDGPLSGWSSFLCASVAAQ